jgi:hypothetical protein
MKKAKLFLSLTSLCFALAILCFGVYASYHTDYKLSGNFSYEVNDAFVSIVTRVYEGEYRTGDDVYESLEAIAFEGELPSNWDYYLSENVYIPPYNSIQAGGDFDLSDIDITMNENSAIYVFEFEITNSGGLDIWIEPNPNWDETLNVYQANSGVVTRLQSDETANVYIFLALDNIVAPINNGTYEIGLTIDSGSCPILDYYTITNQTIYPNNTIPSEVIIPSYIDGNVIKHIPSDGHFDGNTNITTVYVPGTVITLGDGGFADCSNLTTLRIEKGIDNIINCSTFYDSGVTNFRFPNTIKYDDCWDIVDGTPWLANLWEDYNGIATASDGITTYLLSSKNGELLDGTNYDYSDFHIDYVCGSCFDGSSIVQITLPSGVKGIGSYAFKRCSSLTTINLSFGLKKIGNQAFSQCTSLQGIVVPNGVEQIGESAFSGCTSLTSITINSTTPPTIGSSLFNNTNNCPIYVPVGSVDTYKSATNWSTYASRIFAIQ